MLNCHPRAMMLALKWNLIVWPRTDRTKSLAPFAWRGQQSKSLLGIWQGLEKKKHNMILLVTQCWHSTKSRFSHSPIVNCLCRHQAVGHSLSSPTVSPFALASSLYPILIICFMTKDQIWCIASRLEKPHRNAKLSQYNMLFKIPRVVTWTC